MTATSALEGQPIRRVTRDGTEFVLLGTAHVSRRSAEAVVELADAESFDAIAVELCKSRFDALSDPDSWQNMDLFAIIRNRKAGLVAANLALGAYQRRLADQFGIEPGAEMKAALKAAMEQSVPHLLIDRDIGITLKRVFRSVGFLTKVSIMGGLMGSLFSREEIREEDIERLKEGDMLESTFAEFAAQSEPLYQSLIAERDAFMAAQLRRQASEKSAKSVLAVIGAGHLKGLAEALEEEQDPPDQIIDELDQAPTGRHWTRLIPWLITAAILAGFAIGFARSPELGWQLVLIWVLINGTLAALGAAIARGHPLTILSAFVAAPLTSLNPTIAAGFVTATVETWVRKPQVSDFAALRDDVVQLSGWWRNRVSRVLLVLILSNVGSILGTWIAGFKIFGRLS